MTLEEFDDGLLRWGRDLARWPEQDRIRAGTLLETDPQARALLEEMAAFDAGLGRAMQVDIAEGALAARVQAALQERRDWAGLWSLLPVKKIFAFGSLAGIGGAAAALVTPLAVNSTALLAIALGGMP